MRSTGLREIDDSKQPRDFLIAQIPRQRPGEPQDITTLDRLWFSSKWNGSKTLEQVLTGGNLVVRAGPALQAEGEGAAQATASLNAEQLQPIAAEAIARWAASGISADQVKALNDVYVQIADLEGSDLGLAFGNSVWIDQDAAGYGWFIDLTPSDNREFRQTRITGELAAKPFGAAAGEMDLLTVVMHELGHVLGLPDLGGSSHNLMSETLPTGERHLFAVPGSPGVGHKRLVVMESAVSETAASLRLPEARDGWLTEFLNGYADPNDRIAIDLSDKGKEDPNFNPWKRYGKRARN